MLPGHLPDSDSVFEHPRNSKFSSEQKGVVIAGIVMAVVGWGGLVQLVTTTRPRIGGELWLLFILLQIAITGTVIPVLRFFSLRFTSVDDDPLPAGVVVRRSVAVGIFIVSSAWLLIPRALSLSFVLILMLILLVIEVFLRNRELANER